MDTQVDSEVSETEDDNDEKRRNCCDVRGFNGAGNEARTRDPQLGKLMLYQLSYSRTVTYASRL